MKLHFIMLWILGCFTVWCIFGTLCWHNYGKIRTLWILHFIWRFVLFTGTWNGIFKLVKCQNLCNWFLLIPFIVFLYIEKASHEKRLGLYFSSILLIRMYNFKLLWYCYWSHRHCSEDVWSDILYLCTFFVELTKHTG